MGLSGMWPKSKVEEIIYLLDWYTHMLRPFMWEFYGIMTVISEAGLTNHSTESNDENNADPMNTNVSKLTQLHEEYITRFKFMCSQIEEKFFTDGNTYMFGNKPSLADFVLYQELLSAMLLSGQGS